MYVRFVCGYNSFLLTCIIFTFLVILKANNILLVTYIQFHTWLSYVVSELQWLFYHLPFNICVAF